MSTRSKRYDQAELDGDVVIDPANLRLSVAGDIVALERPLGTWADNFMEVTVREIKYPIYGSAGTHSLRFISARIQ